MKLSEPIDVILLCGGRGKRLHSVTQDLLPKSLFPVRDMELIQYSLKNLDYDYINCLIFAVDYHSDALKKWIDELELPCKVKVSTQADPGIRGAVSSALAHLEKDLVAICNTDEIRLGLSLPELIEAHLQKPRVLATMAAGYSDHLYRHRSLVLDKFGLVLESSLKNPIYKYNPLARGIVNAGFILFDKAGLEYSDVNYGDDWNSIINPLIDSQQLKALVVQDLAYFNVGTPLELKLAKSFLEAAHRRAGQTDKKLL